MGEGLAVAPCEVPGSARLVEHREVGLGLREAQRLVLALQVDQITAHLEQVRERDGLAVQLHLPATAARHGAHDLQAAPRFGRDPDLREASRARGVARQVEDRRDPSRLGIAPYDL